MLGPIIAGNVAARVSWRWFFWACTIAQALNFISLIFFFPETRRLEPEPVTPASIENTIDEKTGTTTSAELERQPSSVVDEFLGRGKPSRQQFNIIQPIDRKALSTIFRHIVTPVEIFFFPIVFWAAMTMGAAANSLLCVNLLQSQALAAPPYNFSPGNVGFANFALAVGAVLGLIVAGPLSDWVAMRATKKNGGIREPEMRLPALIPFIVLGALGLIITGVGFQKGWPWESVIIVGFTFVGMLTVAIPTISITVSITSLPRPVDRDANVFHSMLSTATGRSADRSWSSAR